jgi:hypothetical protein
MDMRYSCMTFPNALYTQVGGYNIDPEISNMKEYLL